MRVLAALALFLLLSGGLARAGEESEQKPTARLRPEQAANAVLEVVRANEQNAP